MVDLAAAVFATWRQRGGVLNTTAGIAGGAFWEEEGLAAEGTLPLALHFLLVIVVKGVSSTAGSSTAISTSGDGSWGGLGP